MIRKMRKIPAFTMIELMVVVVVIGVLVAVAFPNYKKYIARAKLAEAISFIGTISKYEISYYNEFYNGSTRSEFLLLGGKVWR